MLDEKIITRKSNKRNAHVPTVFRSRTRDASLFAMTFTDIFLVNICHVYLVPVILVEARSEEKTSESRNAKLEEIGKATVLQDVNANVNVRVLENVSRCIVFCGFHDVVVVLRLSIRLEACVLFVRAVTAKDERGEAIKRTEPRRHGIIPMKEKEK